MLSIPPWVRRTDAALNHALNQIRLVGAVTPTNWGAELARAREALAAGQPCRPAFRYEAPDPRLAELAEALRRLADGLLGANAGGAGASLAELYAARAMELAAEADICVAMASGAESVRAAASERFKPAGLDEATTIAEQWLTEEPAAEEDTIVRTDDESDPRSLVRRMSKAVSELRLPCRVVVHTTLASLAATGDGIIWVAAGRELRTVDVERTVRHEIVGHLLPRERAKTAPVGLLRVGTAGGSDDQEGYALVLEEEGGFLGPGSERRRTLAFRHLAASLVREGAPLDDIVGRLSQGGASVEQCVVAVLRALRGGGIAREIVYLPAYARVRKRLAAEPDLRGWLAAGSVGLDAIPALRAAFGSAPSWGADVATG